MLKTLMLHPVAFVVVGIATTASAQIFLKIGSSYDLFKLKWLFYLLLSLSSYSVSFLSYYLALRYYEISKISPIMMASVVLIVAVYGFSVGESCNLYKIFGIILGVISIYLISHS